MVHSEKCVFLPILQKLQNSAFPFTQFILKFRTSRCNLTLSDRFLVHLLMFPWKTWVLFLCYIYLLAFLLGIHGAVSAVKELPLEELHRDDCEDKHEELVHNEDVEDVLQRRDHTVKNSLRGRLTRGTPQKERAVNELATTEKKQQQKRKFADMAPWV